MEHSESRKSKIAKKREVELQKILSILHKWGIHTLGQLAALDKEELRSRLGSEAVRLWERANGAAIRLLQFVQPPETFEESFEFEHEIETAEPLLFMLRRFLEQLALRLRPLYLVTQELTLRISFAGSRQVRHGTDSSNSRNEPAVVPTASRMGKETDASATPVRLGPCTYQRVFKIPQPTNDVDLLFRMLQTHLENFKSEQPIVAVALHAIPSRPVSQQFGLFETALKNPQQLFETLARLNAMLGPDRIGTPVLEETHRPDAFRMEPFAWNAGGTTSMAPVRLGPSQNLPDGTEPVPRILKPALRRFRPPANAAIFISENRHLHCDKVRGQIVDRAGPFFLSGNWWDEKSWARAEWDMELEGGELVQVHEADGSWKLDGIYD